MTMSANRRQLLVGAAAFTIAAPHVARAATRTVRLGGVGTQASHYGQGCQVMADAVAAHPDLSSVLKVEARFNGEMGDELAMLKDCRQSTADLVICSTIVVGAFCPEAELLDAPFVFKSMAQGRAAMAGALGAEYAALLKEKSINVLAWCENGMRHVAASRPIRTPKDMEGLKLRVPQSDVMVNAFKSLGADAKPLPYNQIYEALRVGQFEAAEMPIAPMESMKVNEVQKYLSLTGHSYSTGMLLASPDLLEDLSPPQVVALKACAETGAERTRQVVESAEKEGVARLQKGGMTLVDNVDVPAFLAACKPATESLSQRFGAERVQRLIAAGA